MHRLLGRYSEVYKLMNGNLAAQLCQLPFNFFYLPVDGDVGALRMKGDARSRTGLFLEPQRQQMHLFTNRICSVDFVQYSVHFLFCLVIVTLPLADFCIATCKQLPVPYFSCFCKSISVATVSSQVLLSFLLCLTSTSFRRLCGGLVLGL